MSTPDLINTVIAACAMGALGWGLLTFFFTRSEAKTLRLEEADEKKSLRLQEADKKYVLDSVGKLAEVMSEFRVTQKQTEKDVQTIHLMVRELQVKFDFFIGRLETYDRGPIVDTGDGKKYDPSKVNKR